MNANTKFKKYREDLDKVEKATKAFCMIYIIPLKSSLDNAQRRSFTIQRSEQYGMVDQKTMNSRVLGHVNCLENFFLVSKKKSHEFHQESYCKSN